MYPRNAKRGAVTATSVGNEEVPSSSPTTQTGGSFERPPSYREGRLDSVRGSYPTSPASFVAEGSGGAGGGPGVSAFAFANWRGNAGEAAPAPSSPLHYQQQQQQHRGSTSVQVVSSGLSNNPSPVLTHSGEAGYVDPMEESNNPSFNGTNQRRTPSGKEKPFGSISGAKQPPPSYATAAAGSSNAALLGAEDGMTSQTQLPPTLAPPPPYGSPTHPRAKSGSFSTRGGSFVLSPATSPGRSAGFTGGNSSIREGPGSPHGYGHGPAEGEAGSASPYDYSGAPPAPLPTYFPQDNMHDAGGSGQGRSPSFHSAPTMPPPPPPPPPPPTYAGYPDSGYGESMGPGTNAPPPPAWAEPPSHNGYMATHSMPPAQHLQQQQQQQPQCQMGYAPFSDGDAEMGGVISTAEYYRGGGPPSQLSPCGAVQPSVYPSQQTNMPPPQVPSNMAPQHPSTYTSRAQQPQQPVPAGAVPTPAVASTSSSAPLTQDGPIDSDVRTAVPQPTDARYTHLFEEFTKVNRARTRLAQEIERVRREAQDLANELSHYRGREAEAAHERDALRNAYTQDVTALLATVHGLLDELHATTPARKDVMASQLSPDAVLREKSALLERALSRQLHAAPDLPLLWICSALGLRFVAEGIVSQPLGNDGRVAPRGANHSGGSVENNGRSGSTVAAPPAGSAPETPSTHQSHPASSTAMTPSQPQWGTTTSGCAVKAETEAPGLYPGASVPEAAFHKMTRVLAQDEVHSIVHAAHKELHHFLAATDFTLVPHHGVLSDDDWRQRIPSSQPNARATNGVTFSTPAAAAATNPFGGLHLVVEVPPVALHANVSAHLLAQHQGSSGRGTGACGTAAAASDSSLMSTPHTAPAAAPRGSVSSSGGPALPPSVLGGGSSTASFTVPAVMTVGGGRSTTVDVPTLSSPQAASALTTAPVEEGRSVSSTTQRSLGAHASPVLRPAKAAAPAKKNKRVLKLGCSPETE